MPTITWFISALCFAVLATACGESTQSPSPRPESQNPQVETESDTTGDPGLRPITFDYYLIEPDENILVLEANFCAGTEIASVEVDESNSGAIVVTITEQVLPADSTNDEDVAAIDCLQLVRVPLENPLDGRSVIEGQTNKQAKPG